MSIPVPDGYAWEDPPARGRRTSASKYIDLDVLATLHAYPGKTLRLPPFSKRSTAETAKKSIAGAVGNIQEWDLVTRALDDSMYGLYVTYVGQPAAPDAEDLLG